MLAGFFSILLIGKTAWPISVAETSIYEPLKADSTAVFASNVDAGEVLGASTSVFEEVEEMYSYNAHPEIEYEIGRSPQDERVAKLEGFLYSKGSPMASYSDLIVYYSDIYGVDPRLCVAIAGLESGYGRVVFRPYNAWGFYSGRGWGSWEESIREYMEGMNRGYFSEGARTPEAIGKNYAADPNWASRIRGYMSQISL